MEKDFVICPICKQNLEKRDKEFVCKNNHSFDISKEGYVNLLLVNKKHSHNPGDSKEMVVARDNFLQLGFFERLKNFIQQTVIEGVYNRRLIIEAGCGTGYYLNGFENEFNNCIGIDISKEAVKTAAKSNKKAMFIVASIFEMPIKPNSVDCILNIFAPKPVSEFERVLANNGIVVEVVPGERHLIEIKNLLYEQGKERTAEYKSFNIKLESSNKLTYQCNLSDNELISLIKMTPFFYKTSKADLEKLKNVKTLTVTFDFVINLYKKEI